MITLKATTRSHFLLLIIPAAFLVQSCAEKPAARPQTRQYAIDQGGLASVCNVPKVTPTDGKETPVAMSMGNDGGRCSISVRQDGPSPYGAGLLTKRAEHGMVYIHTVGDDTRIDYTPKPGFAGQDSFNVRLVPGDALLQVSVNVTK